MKIGRPTKQKGHFSSPGTYLVDIIKLSELPLYEDASFLHQKYIKERLPAKEIATLLGCSTTTIKARLRAFGITKGHHATHRAKLPFGTKMTGHKLTTQANEAKIIESIRRMYVDEKLGVSAIARILNSMKVPTKKQGKAWDHSVITAILEREGVYKQTRKSPRKEGKNEL